MHFKFEFRRVAIACVIACAAVPGSAVAQQPVEPSLSRPASGAQPRPWAKGVPQRAQAQALELYLAGNSEFTESRFPQALAKYKEAIRHWDHPAIHFNMAVALINLDQPVEANEHLEKSLGFGAAPLSASLYAQGLTYRKLLRAQLVRIRIVSSDAGARISFDGKALLTGPGNTELVVLPGEHQVVATKEGFMTSSETVVLPAGKGKIYELRPTLEPKPAAAGAQSLTKCTCYSPEIATPDYNPSLPQASKREVQAVNPFARSPGPSVPLGATTPLASRFGPVPGAPANGIQLSSPDPTKGETEWEAIVRKALEPTPPPASNPFAPDPSATQEASMLSPFTQPTGFQLPIVPVVPPPPAGLAYQPPSWMNQPPMVHPPTSQPIPMSREWLSPLPQPTGFRLPPLPSVPSPPAVPAYQPPDPTPHVSYPIPMTRPQPGPHQASTPMPTPYTPPTPIYTPPTPTYTPPARTYTPPTPTYTPPVRTYTPPTPTYTPPVRTYTPPTPTYTPPVRTYTPPTPTYTPPTPTYRPR